MNAFQSFENAKAAMAEDVATPKFVGNTVVGRHGLISIDLLAGKLKARTAPDAKVSCYLNLPTAAGEEAVQRLGQIFMNPKLRRSFNWPQLPNKWPTNSSVWALETLRLK
jgi:hypothetical protein